MQLYVKMPTRSRPHKALPLLEQYVRTAAAPYHLAACLQADDPSMLTEDVRAGMQRINELAVAKNILFEVFVHTGSTKVSAYNAEPTGPVDRRLTEWFGLVRPERPKWDIQVATSDDMVPFVEGWDEKIVGAMEAFWPNTDGVLHFFDNFRAELMTLPIVGRKWYSRFGWIYFPGYQSVYCDNEMQETAQLMGKYKYIDVCLIEHRHPLWVNEQYDDQMRHTESRPVYQADRTVFRKRQARKFGLVRRPGNVWDTP